MKESKVIKGIKFREVGESGRTARYPGSKVRAERRLSAILSADVQSYSRLMNKDEAETIRTLQNYRLIIATHVESFNGRIVDSSGDNILAEFASAVDAVEAAVEIQRDLKKRNSELPEEDRMIFRIGINLGDIVSEGENIYGDSVNIAARIETLALADGYWFAIGFGAGGCRDTMCNGGLCQMLDSGRCPNILRARPSMEGVGINVVDLVGRVGWAISPIYRSCDPKSVPCAISVGIVFIQ